MSVTIKAMPQEYEYEVIQDGIVVASAWGRDKQRVLSEAMHYAMMYAQDGPVEVRMKPDKRKRRSAQKAGDGK